MPFNPVLFAVGAASKLFLRFGCSDVRIDGLSSFLGHLKSGRPILTIANHVSVVDEPFMWGALPMSTFLDSRRVRWTLGAADIMFRGRLDRWFFTSGQVIETFRGKGIYQDAVDTAAHKLKQGRWVHIFPEGRVKQENLTELRRFKWGVSRILMEAAHLRTAEQRAVSPLVIPIWLTGFEKTMPEDRPIAFKPSFGHRASITFGSPVQDSLEPLMDEYKTKFSEPWRPATYDREIRVDLAEEPTDLARLRSEMAKVLRAKLTELGQNVHEAQKIER